MHCQVPHNWAIKRLDEAGHVDAGRQRSPHHIAGKPRVYLRVANVMDGYIDTSDLKWMPFTDAEFERFRLLPGDILLNEGQSLGLVGRAAIYRGVPEDCCFQNTLIRFRAQHGTNADYALQLFRFFMMTGRFASIASQTTSIAHLGVSRFAALRAVLPPLPTQRTIADILGAWDRAIEWLQALVKGKTAHLSGLRQQLLSGSRRFRTFRPDRWSTTALSNVAESVSRRNEGRLTDDRLHAVTKVDGLVPMRDRVKGETTARCKEVARDCFAYNPMRLNIGSIARWKGEKPVMVSGDYVVFRCDEQHLLPDYLDHLRRTSRWTGFVRVAGNGSVRVRIYFPDLGRFTFPLPSLAEQRRITDLLNACEREISLVEAQLEALKQQKRGLMQELLTGEIRVNP